MLAIRWHDHNLIKKKPKKHDFRYWGRQSNPGDAAGYRWTYGTVPLVDRFKFVTEGKWMTNICERYAKNKTNDLHMAWFNGIGFESWENVWGRSAAQLARTRAPARC